MKAVVDSDPYVECKYPYMNCVCARCKGIISVYHPRGYQGLASPYLVGSNRTFHMNCRNKIDQEEQVCYLPVSFSSEPLEDAVEVIDTSLHIENVKKWNAS